jgi:hypothetical protein
VRARSAGTPGMDRAQRRNESDAAHAKSAPSDGEEIARRAEFTARSDNYAPQVTTNRHLWLATAPRGRLKREHDHNPEKESRSTKAPNRPGQPAHSATPDEPSRPTSPLEPSLVERLQVKRPWSTARANPSLHAEDRGQPAPNGPSLFNPARSNHSWPNEPGGKRPWSTAPNERPSEPSLANRPRAGAPSGTRGEPSLANRPPDRGSGGEARRPGLGGWTPNEMRKSPVNVFR